MLTYRPQTPDRIRSHPRLERRLNQPTHSRRLFGPSENQPLRLGCPRSRSHFPSIPVVQKTGSTSRLETGDQRGQLRVRLCHFAASMQSMTRAGSHAGPKQTEELISNSKCVAAPFATYYPDHASSRACPATQTAPLIGRATDLEPELDFESILEAVQSTRVVKNGCDYRRPATTP